MRNLISTLYQVARIVNDISKLCSGNPRKIGRRLVNKWVGRNIARRLYLR